MIYLNKGFLMPSEILVSIVLLPCSICCWGLTFTDFDIDVFIGTVFVSSLYILASIIFYKLSNSKKDYLFVEEGSLVVNFSNVCPKINISDIVKIEYYKITSIRAWCMLCNSVFPQCVYITYLHEGKEVCSFIGYPKQNEIKRICDDFKIDFKTR